MENNRIYPVLPLRNVIVFPNTVLPIFVGRRKSLLSLEESLKKRQVDSFNNSKKRGGRRT